MTAARAVSLFLVAASASGLYVGLTGTGVGRAAALLFFLVTGAAAGVITLESRRAAAQVGVRSRPGRHRA
jgi:hypothetical protein